MAEGMISWGEDVDGKVWIMERSILTLMGAGKSRRSWPGSQNMV
jgi:hypothetical protein